jgi:hypothetical protein
MKDENNDTPQAPSSRKLVKRLSIAGGAVFLLIIIGYLSVTSGAFVKSVVLPKLSKALNAEVTVTDASVGLFSGVSMKGLRVVSAETDLVKAGEATLRYSFWALASGRIEVSEFTLDAPEVFLVQNPDGTSNLTPILEALNSEDADKKKKEATASTSGAPEVDLRNIVLKNAKLRFESYSTNGVEVVEASPVAINVDHVGNGIDGELKLSTGVTFERGPKLDEPVDAIYAEMNAAFSFGLDANLLPKGLKGNSTITVNSAKGAFANADKLVASLNLDLDLTTIRDLSLDVKRGEQLLSSVKLSGPFNAETLDADLDLQLSGIDRNILSLVTAPLMIDLGDTAINSQNQLQLREQGTQFSLKGELKIDKLSVKKDALTTPVVDGAFRYQAGVDLNSSSAKLEAFDLGVTQAGRQLIGSSLTKPLSITWAGEPGVTGDSELQLKIDNLNLAEWAAVAGEYVSAGTVNAEWKLEASNGGKDVTISGNEALQGLRVKIGTNWVDQINVSAFLNASVTNQNAGSLKVFEVRTDRAGREIAAIAANGNFDIAKMTGNVGYSIQTDLAETSKLLAVPGVNVSVGLLTLRGQLLATGEKSANLTGKLSLPGFSGGFEKFQFNGLTLDSDIAASLAGDLSKLDTFTGNMTHGGQPAGGFDIAGSFDSGSKAASATVKLMAINQNLLKAVLDPLLTGMRLAQGRIDSALALDHQPAGETKVSGDLSVTDLVILDQSGTIPAVPLGIATKLDARLSGTPHEGLKLSLPTLSGDLTQSGQKSGSFNVSANFDSKTLSGDFDVKVADLDERFIGPFAGNALKPMSLRSILVNVGATGRLNLNASSTVKADISVDRVVVDDPSGQIPPQPLALKLGLDTEMDKKLIKLNQLVLKLSPTERANNELNIRGAIDLTDINATRANLAITSAGLDVTPYYDLFAGRQAPAATPEPAAPPAPKTNEEPPAITLPVKNSEIKIDIAKFFLRKIEAANIVTVAKLDRHTIKADPVKMAFNGAPVAAYLDLDLSKPGYIYDVRFSADRVPLSPAISSFFPPVGNRTKGELVANMNVKGQGITGVNLKQYLNGNLGFYVTNAAIYIVAQSKKTPPPQTGFLAGFKQMGGSMLSGSFKSIAGGLGIPDLSQTPITHVDARVEMGDGMIRLKNADIISSAFKVGAAGDISIQPVLGESPVAIPVDIWLATKTSSKIKFTSINGDFGQLPRFVEIGGTVDVIEVKVDKAAMAGALFGGVGGTVGGLTKEAGNFLQGIGGKGGGIGNALGGFLGGNKSGGTAATNAPANPKPDLGKALGGFLGGFGRKPANTSTNAPTVKTNKPSGGFFKGIPGFN